MITTVTGDFKSYSIEAETETDDFATAKSIAFSASINSIDTKNEQRDGHLKSADFFEAEKFPTLTFSGKSFEKKSGDEYLLNGDLTIKGVTKPVTLNVEHSGIAKDPWGNTKAGFEVTGKINRKDFGLSWGALTEAGGAVVSDEVKLLANIQLVKQ